MLVDLVPEDSVTRPSQYFGEIVVSHAAESSRNLCVIESPLLLGPYEFLLRADLYLTCIPLTNISHRAIHKSDNNATGGAK